MHFLPLFHCSVVHLPVFSWSGSVRWRKINAWQLSLRPWERAILWTHTAFLFVTWCTLCIHSSVCCKSRKATYLLYWKCLFFVCFLLFVCGLFVVLFLRGEDISAVWKSERHRTKKKTTCMTTYARCSPQVHPLLSVVLSVTSPSCAQRSAHSTRCSENSR